MVGGVFFHKAGVCLFVLPNQNVQRWIYR